MPIEVAGDPSEAGPSKRLQWTLAGAYFAVLLAQACVAPLQEPDEGRCASICWEMIRTGDWITPHLNGIRYYEKPPLYFWLASVVMGAVGHVDVALRLPSVLASFLTVLLVGHWGTRRNGSRTGLLAAAVLASLFLFALLARVALVDPLLALCITFSLYAADRSAVDPPAGISGPDRWMFAFWGALGLAALVKGPIGVVLPLATLAAFLLLTRDRRGFRTLFRLEGIALFALVSSPWYVLMSLRNSDYPVEFLVGQNLDRLVEGSRFNRDKPLWYYIPVLLVGFLPWSLFFPRVVTRIREAFANRTAPASRWTLLLGSAVLFPFLILSFAHSKLPHYLIPLCPPIALLLGGALCAEWKKPGSREGSPAFGAVAFTIFGLLELLFALALLVPAWMDPGAVAGRLGYRPEEAGHEADLARIRRFQSPLPGAAGILGIIGISGLCAGWMIRRGRPQSAALSLSAAVLLGVLGAQTLIAPMGPAISARALATKVGRHLADDVPVLLYRRYLRGLTYYLQRSVILWEGLYNEFGHEIVGPEAATLTLRGDPTAIKPFLERHPAALIVVESPSLLLELESITGMAFDVLDREGDFLVVRVGPRR